VRSSRVDTFTLVTLGRLTLLSPSGEESESLAKRRLKLALLAVIATAKRPLSRATLVEMFWGDQDEARARHSLSDALSHLRRELGRAAITTRDADVSLGPDAPVSVDAVMFSDAADAHDFARAAELYAGPFLEGVEIEAGASFEHWVTRERRRLESLFIDACARQCLAHARAREWGPCGALAARWLDAAPLSVDAALYRLNALKAPGTREAAQLALDEYTQITARLAREYDLPPDRSLQQLAETIRASLPALPEPAAVAAPATAVAGTTPNAAPDAALDAASDDVSNELPPDRSPHGSAPEMTRPTEREPAPTKRRGNWRQRAARVASAGVALVALVGAVAATARTSEPSSPPRPRVAISIDVSPVDSSAAWLADGLPQMIVSELARSHDIEVVPPAQVSALLRRRGDGARRSIDSTTDLTDLSRRLGATVVVRGSVAHDDHALVLDLTIRDAATGRLLRSDALSRTDAVALADEAAARVLTTVDAERPGLHIADLETSSVEAYQNFIRASKDEQAGLTRQAVRDLDAAVALDSGFVSALHARLDYAVAGDEFAVADRLRAALARTDARATDFDRLRSQAYETLYAGETEHSEAIAHQLVRRYPRDPRAYGVLNAVLETRGRFADAESMWRTALSLDSLTMEAGSGPCSPCSGFGVLTRLQIQQGKWADAERSARRWVQLQPDAPAAWATLTPVLAYQQRSDEALDAVHHAISLSGGDPATLDMLGRVLLSSRRYDTVDSLVTAWLAGRSPGLRTSALDLRELLLRERGQFRAADSAVVPIWGEPHSSGAAPDLMHGSNLSWLGDYKGAEIVYERASHPAGSPEVFPPRGTGTRGYCWHHALLADAIAPAGDTKRLAAIADTLEIGCAKSFFGRDRVLYHHVRGLVALQQQHLMEAVVELQQARWGVAEGWTRTNVALAEAQLRLGQARLAVQTLRDAYAGPLDGMGRYEPRSHLDFLMARAYRKAGQADSANVYEAYVRRAWRDADPEVRRLLDSLR
jgi:DNA-binding SARP family transcriptional activator/TolB-like protein/Tfp pilus assembly protein PilF